MCIALDGLAKSFAVKHSNLFLLFLLVASIAGCATDPAPPGSWQGPSAPAAISTTPWKFDGGPAQCLITPHYRIYTTVNDTVLVDQIGQLMEGALVQYQRLTGTQLQSGQKAMVCYLFASRPQWATETVQAAGPDAPLYLQVNRGGYTYNDVYVAYFLGEAATYSVTAHEGFHQYAARNLPDRILPFLEEGMACMFEQMRWENGLPRWNLRINGGRLSALRDALQYGRLWSVQDLVEMHAGQIVGQPPGRISAFYAECWAFAEWMREGDAGLHQQALQQMMTDSAAGKLWGNGYSHDARGPRWRKETLQPTLEHYLNMPIADIQKSFDAYVKQRCDE